MTSIRHKIINNIIDREGGYVNDSSDSGGETNFGVTINVARDYGYFGNMKDLPREVAFDIYEKKYWNDMKLPYIEVQSEAVAEELADTAVNMGVGRAGRFFQRSLNALNNRGQIYPDLVVDGKIGEKTTNAFWLFKKHRGSDADVIMLRALNALQGAFYIELAERREKDEKFLAGWLLNRVQ